MICQVADLHFKSDLNNIVTGTGKKIVPRELFWLETKFGVREDGVVLASGYLFFMIFMIKI